MRKLSDENHITPRELDMALFAMHRERLENEGFYDQFIGELKNRTDVGIKIYDMYVRYREMAKNLRF